MSSLTRWPRLPGLVVVFVGCTLFGRLTRQAALLVAVPPDHDQDADSGDGDHGCSHNCRPFEGAAVPGGEV